MNWNRTLRAVGKGRFGQAVRLGSIIVAGLIVLPYLLTMLYGMGAPVSTLMLGRWVAGKPVHRQWMPLAAMGRAVPLAVIVAEDARFCSHGGVDWGALREVIEDAQEGERTRGGSTITQQTVKNLFLWGGRSYLRKALELPLALWMDLVLSKRRILEIYLNIAEWGPGGQFGAEAGARHAFGREAAKLTRYQAALLASVLPNPHRRSARHPTAGVRRLGAIYSARMRAASSLADCVEGR